MTTTANIDKCYFNASGRTLLVMEGKDAIDFLQRMTSNEVSDLGRSRSVTTALTTEKGRIIDVLSAVPIDGGRILLSGQSHEPAVVSSWLEKYIIMDDVRLQPADEHLTHYILFMHESQRLAPAETDDMVEMSSQFTEYNIDKQEVGPVIFNEYWDTSSYSHILVPKEMSGLVESLLHGRGYKSLNLEQFENARIAAGIPTHPNELCEQFNPLEMGMSGIVSTSKGCYVGQEVLARLVTYNKVHRALTRLVANGSFTTLPLRLTLNGSELGWLTSVSPTQKGGRRNALACLENSFIESSVSNKQDIQLDQLILNLI